MKKLFEILLMALFIVFIAICNGCKGRGNSAIAVESLDVAELEKQAERGNTDAQVELGRLYYNGERGKKEDNTEAVKWFQKAADNGNVYGKYWLGTCYDYGNGVEKSYTKANPLYKEAFTAFSKMAEADDAKAQYYLGKCYNYGNGTEENKELSFAAYKKAAELGYARAQDYLGDCYKYGFLGVKESDTLAMKWYRMAAEQGYAIAQVDLGDCYYYGDSLTKSYTEAEVV